MSRHTIKIKNLFYPILLLLLQFTVNGQNIVKIPAGMTQTLTIPEIDTIPIINLFEEDDPLNITLTHDISSFIKTKNSFVGKNFTFASIC